MRYTILILTLAITFTGPQALAQVSRASTALTLILVPVLYRLVEGRRERRALQKALPRRRPSGPASGADDFPEEFPDEFPDDFPEDASLPTSR